MKTFDIYLYGMIVRTHSFLLRDDFLKADAYGEINEKYCLTGGETGTAATVLAALGCRVKMDGNHLGYQTADTIRRFYTNVGVDISALYEDPAYEGLEDYVIIDRHTRTVFGTFARYFSEGIQHWNTPSQADIQQAKAAGIDPFFGEQSLLAARYCNESGVPFVTLDCAYDSEMCRLSSIIAVSGEYRRGAYPDYDGEEGKIRLFQQYTKHTNALVIFTSGSGTVMYGRNGETHCIPAYQVHTVSTLGAGDTFKAGCVYGLLREWSDDDTVRFAAACAAVACTKFPLPLNPPTMEEVHALMQPECIT